MSDCCTEIGTIYSVYLNGNEVKITDDSISKLRLVGIQKEEKETGTGDNRSLVRAKTCGFSFTPIFSSCQNNWLKDVLRSNCGIDVVVMEEHSGAEYHFKNASFAFDGEGEPKDGNWFEITVNASFRNTTIVDKK